MCPWVLLPTWGDTEPTLCTWILDDPYSLHKQIYSERDGWMDGRTVSGMETRGVPVKVATTYSRRSFSPGLTQVIQGQSRRQFRVSMSSGSRNPGFGSPRTGPT